MSGGKNQTEKLDWLNKSRCDCSGLALWSDKREGVGGGAGQEIQARTCRLLDMFMDRIPVSPHSVSVV